MPRLIGVETYYGKIKALHHPFTMPNLEKCDLDNIDDIEGN